MFVDNFPQMSDVNDTPYDRYVVVTLSDESDDPFTFATSYLYFIEEAYDAFEKLKAFLDRNSNHLGLSAAIVLNEPGETFSQSFDDTVLDDKKFSYHALPIPDDRNWDIRDNCFPFVLFPTEGENHA